MFWGLIMEPNKRYTQIVEKSFHVSMASLDLRTADDNAVQVMLCYEDRNHLLCTLRKDSTWQTPLDLNFQEGTKISFTCNGHGHVHLTGYFVLDGDLDLDDLEEEEEEENEEVPQLVSKQLKRKAVDSLKDEKKLKRHRKKKEAESPNDSIELDGINENENEDSEDEEDEEEVDDENEDEDEDDDDDDEEEEEEEEDDEDEDVEEEEEEEETTVKPQQQKDKKNKQAQEEQRQKKKDQKKLVNGTEMQQAQQNKQEKKNKGEKQQNVQIEQKKRVVEGGVQIEDLKIGNGAPAKAGKFVSVYYVGRLKNGQKFDSTTRGDGLKFRLGKGEVIKGWDVGIAGMKVGGKRRITIPPAMGYGAKGSPPVIPGNSTLIFEVELRNIH